MSEGIQAREVALRASLDAKQAEVDAILAKSEITQDDIIKATSLQDEQVAIRSELEQIRGIVAQNENLKSFSTMPAPGGARVLGMVTNAGTTYLDSTSKGTTVYNEGEGVLSQRQMNTLNDDAYSRAFKSYLRCGGNHDALDSIDLKTLREGTDTEGGYLVPLDMLREIISKSPAPSRVRGRVRRIRTSGKEITVPRVNYTTDDIYTSGVRVTLAGESPSAASVHRVTDPVFGQTRITNGTWMMSMPITNDMVEDEMFDIVGWATGKFAETNELLEDNQILNGTGIGAYPHGIFKNPGGTGEPAITLSSTNDNIDAAQIRGMPYDLPEQYINDNTAWVFNRNSVGRAIATMAGISGEFIFRTGDYDNGLAARHPDTLDGFPIVYSAFCANIAASTNVGVFGDLQGYYLAERIGFSVRVLNERYAEENQIVLLGRKRFGGCVAEAFRMRVMRSDNA